MTEERIKMVVKYPLQEVVGRWYWRRGLAFDWDEVEKNWLFYAPVYPYLTSSYGVFVVLPTEKVPRWTDTPLKQVSGDPTG